MMKKTKMKREKHLFIMLNSNFLSTLIDDSNENQKN